MGFFQVLGLFIHEITHNLFQLQETQPRVRTIDLASKRRDEEERRRSSEDIPLERMNRSNSFTDLIPTGFRNTLEMVDSANFNIFNLRDISEN